MSDPIDNVIELAKQAEQTDVAVAMEQIRDAINDNEDDPDAIEDAMEGMDLPFYEQDRELAFTVGLYFGAALEEEYGDLGDEDEE